MKYLLVSDLHHKGRVHLDEIIQKEKPDRILFVGDYDTIQTLRIVEKISKKIHSLVIPGNHDFAIYLGEKITSQTFIDQGHSSQELNEMIMPDNNSNEREFLESILFTVPKSKKSPACSKEFFIDPDIHSNHYKTLFIHDALESTQIMDDVGSMLWKRIKDKKDYHINFLAMRKNRYKVMIRGHDHLPAFGINHRLEGMTLYKPFQDNYPLEYEIKRINQIIITIGSLYYGFYATISTFPQKNIEIEPFNPIIRFKCFDGKKSIDSAIN